MLIFLYVHINMEKMLGDKKILQVMNIGYLRKGDNKKGQQR